MADTTTDSGSFQNLVDNLNIKYDYLTLHQWNSWNIRHINYMQYHLCILYLNRYLIYDYLPLNVVGFGMVNPQNLVHNADTGDYYLSKNHTYIYRGWKTTPPKKYSEYIKNQTLPMHFIKDGHGISYLLYTTGGGSLLWQYYT